MATIVDPAVSPTATALAVSAGGKSRPDDVPMKDDPEWETLSNGGRLVYRGYFLVKFYREDRGVRVRTRCYSEGYQENRLLATPEVARRYGDSWLRKWGDQATREVDNKISWAEGEHQRREEADQRRARGESEYPDIKVRPWKPRRRR